MIVTNGHEFQYAHSGGIPMYDDRTGYICPRCGMVTDDPTDQRMKPCPRAARHKENEDAQG